MTRLASRAGALQRMAIMIIIVSLSVTALIGIYALLTDSIDETKSKVMLTTLTIGIFSVVALCDLAVLGRRFQLVGIAGIAISAVALTFGLILIWGSYFDANANFLWKTFGLTTIIGLSLAHANLLLLLGERRRPAVKIGLWVTIGLIGLLAALLGLLILTDGEAGSDAYGRLVGTVAILDVLGTIVVPVISKFLRDSSPARGMTVELPPELTVRLKAIAAQRGTTAEAMALRALEDLTD